MQFIRSCIVSALIGLSVWAGEPEAPLRLTPAPKVCRRTGGDIGLSASLSIVLGSKATEPERYAAEMLQRHIQKRFGRPIPIHTEGEIPEGVQQVVLLGQAETNTWLARLLREKGIEREPRSEGRDDFQIEIVSDGARQVIVLGGASARAVTYAQDAFFQLLERKGEGIVFPAVSLWDWPSIAWRGRVANNHVMHLAPGMMDAYVRARLNFIDLRQSDRRSDRATASGIRPDGQLDMEQTRREIAEAHRRGILVFCVVWCGVPIAQHGKAIALFERLLDEGVDGIWVSFDDGGKGEAPAKLVQRVLDLAKQRGLPLDRVATTPMIGSYERVETPFNRELAKVGEFAHARWYFTAVPSAGHAWVARKIGLTRNPSWWHNWPRTTGGFLYTGGAQASMREDKAPPYVPLLGIREGWGRPDDKRLASMADHVDGVIYMGLGGPEYHPLVWGIWAWDPEQHNWTRTRDAIYGHVFGRASIPDARAFDDGLLALMSCFHMPLMWPRAGVDWPPRLKAREARDSVLNQVDALEAIVARLAQNAPKATMIDPERLGREFLEPMRFSLVVARGLAGFEFFEYEGNALTLRIERLVIEGKMSEAQKLLADRRELIPERLEQLRQAIKGVKGADGYIDVWKARLANADHFRKAAESARRWHAQAFLRFQKLDSSAARAGISTPPAGAVVAEVAPSSWLAGPLLRNGDVRLGMVGEGAGAAAGVGFVYNGQYTSSSHGELRASLAVREVEGPVALDVFFGEVNTASEAGLRTAQLWVGERLVWKQDVMASDARWGWHSFDITDAVRGGAALELRFRVENVRSTRTGRTLTLIGPVRARRGGAAAPPAAVKPPASRPATPSPKALQAPAPKPVPRPRAQNTTRPVPLTVPSSRHMPESSATVRPVPVPGQEPPNVPLYVFLGLSVTLNVHLLWRIVRRRAGAHS